MEGDPGERSVAPRGPEVRRASAVARRGPAGGAADAGAPPAGPPAVLVVAAELMAASRVESLCRAAGCPVEALDPDAEGARALAGRAPAVVVLDLAAPADVRQAVYTAVARAGGAVVAFGSHVDASGLEAARRAGAAEVLTRGELARGLAQAVHRQRSRLLALAGMPPPPPS